MPDNITSDIYDLAEYVNQTKREFTDINEDTLMLGIFGGFGEVFSNALQNSVIMASEFANEAIPTKAKFEKNIIAHALGLNVTNLNAVPARMDVFLTFIEDEIINQIGEGSGEFIFDCDNKIYFDTYEFHPDYDVIIRRIKLSNGSFTYTAMYDLNREGVFDNPISDITNPYLNPPVVMNINGTRYLFVACLLRQVEKTTIYKKVLSDNTISAKTANFDYTSQLAAFTIDVVNSTGTTHCVPIYEGLTTTTSKYPYIWYTFLDTNNIRIKFDPNSYSPRINSDVNINLITTQGEEGNFTWGSQNYPQFSFDSERLGYTNITLEVRPIDGDSLYGVNKKSMDELKEIIPREALARGSVTTTTDLENYFNSIDTDSSKMYFYKKRDNNIERLNYAYIVMKDAFANIIPTNTTNLIVKRSQLETDEFGAKLILKKGSVVRLDATGDVAYVYSQEDILPFDYTDAFYYIIPYNFAICLDPLYGMYYITTMNLNKNLTFTYINEECQYQYISTYLKWNRQYLSEADTYKLTISTEQNLTGDSSMVEIDEEGKIISSNVKAFIIFYSEDNSPYRWLEGKLVRFDSESSIFTYEFTMKSDDYIDAVNHICVTGLNQIGFDPTTTVDQAYLPSNAKAMIHFVTKQPEYSTDKTFIDFGGNNVDITTLIPTIEDDWCVTNSYEIQNGIDFFFNYSEIIYSTIEVEQDGDTYQYRIMNVPMIKSTYFKNEDMVEYFFGELIKRKSYIDEALDYLEDSFGINFKFFNTYGPSHMFTIDNNDNYLNRVNLTLTFKLSLQTNYDENIVQYITDDIKQFVEGINTINSIHMSNLVTNITRNYSESINFFEFVDMNGYGPGEQHLFAMQMPDNVITPELVNINTLDNQSPDISIIIA